MKKERRKAIWALEKEFHDNTVVINLIWFFICALYVVILLLDMTTLHFMILPASDHDAFICVALIFLAGMGLIQTNLSYLPRSERNLKNKCKEGSTRSAMLAILPISRQEERKFHFCIGLFYQVMLLFGIFTLQLYYLPWLAREDLITFLLTPVIAVAIVILHLLLLFQKANLMTTIAQSVLAILCWFSFMWELLFDELTAIPLLQKITVGINGALAPFSGILGLPMCLVLLVLFLLELLLFFRANAKPGAYHL